MAEAELSVRSIRVRAAGADHPVLTTAPHILAFLPPSLMTRSTCIDFNAEIEKLEAPRKHQTVAADAVTSASLIEWAVQSGLDAALAQKMCVRHRDLNGLLVLHRLHALLPRRDYATIAAEKGDLQLLQWLRQNGIIFSNSDKEVCSSAAAGGHLEVLQWLRRTGCGWNADTCAAAAAAGHLEVLQCPAARGAAVGVRQWLQMGHARYGHLLISGCRGAPRDAAVGDCAWLLLG
eukprot:TRINITY_DN108_c1_g1_i2.p2 TRINITY_DN108_c1_g1~~TRINITY_DN108_c1_g1_i2.p2  ORF type:complete len:234 (+),score=41.14 TRINITY_DN108_c1_g1_i2:154-855(+)